MTSEEEGMDPETIGEATRLLRRIGKGDGEAADKLLPMLYDELHRMARRAMNRSPHESILQPTVVLNEAWLRIERASDTSWQDRSHFLGFAARAMRSVVIDSIRSRRSLKRGGDLQRVELDGALPTMGKSSSDLMELDQALDQLEAKDTKLARIVEMRFFAGASNEQIAAALGVSLRTVERGWAAARTWLYQRLGGEAEQGSPS